MKSSQNAYVLLVKRPLDVIGSIVAIMLLSPLIFVVAMVLYFANKGAGVFFVQKRPGKFEKIFKVIKFKTMNDARDEKGELLPDDMRLTKVGNIVRNLSIDELPQLLNILKGDMSFIGPRPLLVEYLPLYNEKQRHRHDVMPGLSGWAQVNGRNTLSWQEKFRYDLEYVENIGLKMDVKVFLMTVKKVFKGENINHEGCATMELFTGDN